MTQNYVEAERYISVKGIDNAMEVAKVLLKNDYEVFIEAEDLDIYGVHFAEAKYLDYGNPTFYRMRTEDIEPILNREFNKNENEGE